MRKYDKTFKDEAIRLALSSPQPIAKTARDLGRKESLLYSWVSEEKNKNQTITDEIGNQTNLISVPVI